MSGCGEAVKPTRRPGATSSDCSQATPHMIIMAAARKMNIMNYSVFSEASFLKQRNIYVSAPTKGMFNVSLLQCKSKYE